MPASYPIIGFVDETAMLVEPWRRRVVNTMTVRYRSKGKEGIRRINLFGFMAPNGRDVAMASATARSIDFMSLMEAARDANPAGPIVMVLDNAAIHRSEATRRRADELGILLVYLPPYSPDLNPIEIAWRDLKVELARILDFDSLAAASGPAALRLFGERKMSYSARWREMFLNANR
ncbi:MAG: transposase [Conexivisphaera sp.]